MDHRRTGQRFVLLGHHTHAEREFAYDCGATKAVYEARAKGWTVFGMKHERNVIYPPEKKRKLKAMSDRLGQ